LNVLVYYLIFILQRMLKDYFKPLPYAKFRTNLTPPTTTL
jgi:hypothetical protein